MEIITNIINIDRSKSIFFDHFFKITCNEISYEKIEISESIEKIWQLTIEKLQKIIQPINSGEIKLTELDEILVTFFKGNFKLMRLEINYLLDYFKIINLKERKDQIYYWDRYVKKIKD